MTTSTEQLRPQHRLAYEDWIAGEGIPIFESLGGVEDLSELPLRPWARMGGLASFIKMRGTTEGHRGVYVVEIPGGGALNPEKHMYEEAIFVLQGRGLTEVWQEGGPRVSFEWGEGSLFAPPLNTWHRLVNGSREPVLIVAVTTAPQIMYAVHDPDFIFNCAHEFTDRFSGKADFFSRGENRVKVGVKAVSTVWETNFIPDTRAEFLDPNERKAAGGEHTGYRMGRAFPIGHMAQWPVGRYHKAHYHDAGALLVGLQSSGYVLLWPHELGLHPYQSGHGDEVVVVEWRNKSIYTPPDGWYHQHFNTGDEPARHVAVYGNPSTARSPVTNIDELLISTREGGHLIEYEDEDPHIREEFTERLRRMGSECKMPPVVYRTD